MTIVVTTQYKLALIFTFLMIFRISGLSSWMEKFLTIVIPPLTFEEMPGHSRFRLCYMLQC